MIVFYFQINVVLRLKIISLFTSDFLPCRKMNMYVLITVCYAIPMLHIQYVTCRLKIVVCCLGPALNWSLVGFLVK